MGMSTHVVGIRPPDEKWVKMKAIWDASQEVGIPIPAAVLDFFNGEYPDPAGVVVKVPAREWDDGERGAASGYEVLVSEIPKDVQIIRFYNSW